MLTCPRGSPPWCMLHTQRDLGHVSKYNSKNNHKSTAYNPPCWWRSQMSPGLYFTPSTRLMPHLLNTHFNLISYCCLYNGCWLFPKPIISFTLYHMKINNTHITLVTLPTYDTINSFSAPPPHTVFWCERYSSWNVQEQNVHWWKFKNGGKCWGEQWSIRGYSILSLTSIIIFVVWYELQHYCCKEVQNQGTCWLGLSCKWTLWHSSLSNYIILYKSHLMLFQLLYYPLNMYLEHQFHNFHATDNEDLGL